MSEATDDLSRPADPTLLTPAQAGEMLRKMAGDEKGRPQPSNTFDMTREEAGKALDAMAKTQLKQADDPVAAAIAGQVYPDEMHTSPLGSTTLPPMKMAEFAGALRENGFDDRAVECVLREQKVTTAEREAARIRRAELLADPEWSARYLKGDVKARHDMVALTYLTTAAVVEAKR
jgi:hypothetical protein